VHGSWAGTPPGVHPKPARVLVVDGNPSLAAVLGELIADEHGFALAGTATTGAEAVRLAGETGADIVLVDERLDDALRSEVLRDLRGCCPRAVLLVWSYDAVHTAVEGADGVLVRGMTFREVVRALRAALRAPQRAQAS
jgi:two-component system, NarL family, nitrate/nitrite response regulator NarL